MFLIPLALLIALIWILRKCYREESAVSGLFSYLGVYSRFYGYGTICLLMGGISSLITIPLSYTLPDFSIGAALFSLAQAAVFLLLFRCFFNRAKARCPEALRRRLLISMLITAFGIAAKILLFFLPAIWAMIEPKPVRASNGKIYYFYGSDVLDENYNIVGTHDGSGKIRIRQN